MKNLLRHGLLLVSILLTNPILAAEKVDKLFVDKSERQHYLLYKQRVIQRYRISLGGQPGGHKQF
ncbi:MAG: hypothetical protein PVG75_03215 [Thioalkalispiraceae bacterium]